MEYERGAAARRRRSRAVVDTALPTTSVRRKQLPATGPFILVVDDVEDNRQLYATYFEYAGFRVEQAVDGEEALRKVGAEPPDVIVMDLSMPRVDGWEATRLLKSNPRTKGIVVVVLTGHATPTDLARAKAAGADAIHTKPCLPQDLLEIVRELLG